MWDIFDYGFLGLGMFIAFIIGYIIGRGQELQSSKLKETPE